MSISLHLYCAATNECVEAVIIGSRPLARLQPTAMGAFLAYHSNLEAKGAMDFSLRNIDDHALEESIIWDDENYRDLLSRNPAAASAQTELENAPSGGIWTLIQLSSEE
ncbi:hypothetical protein JAB5_27490 [Janthinobacterium sp. HH103]|uniref:hypothetical protein n=1 Tax=unclassified Janthinobacterium TaxID=2610881 RepID=UPI000874C4D4|nr:MULTISPECIES: hypothetical protein [unclassified Janthinobacterium]OEZ53005.1 hypothetical protein JAB2_58690 [Janthinobacterium sp. HH100]OEZ76440.1 hypothetical protein JAB5_27490 [Janthinobacterium sp. HH103]QOU76192.1 hypothetical protein JAB4_056920 [Janthinobacterium sp. HH102]